MTGAARVLIAEDERHLGMLLESYLAGRGHRVELVADGRAALDRLRDEPFDVALLDIQMPNVDGLAVLRAVRAAPLPPEVIVMTGNGTVDVAITALQQGAYDYLSKPYRMAEVDLLVTRAAERRRLDRALFAARVASVDDTLLTGYAPLRAVLDAIDRAAPSVRGALVVGEPGTGRSDVARRLHARADVGGVCADVDAATLQETDGASPLGALAIDDRIAALCAATSGGTLHVRRVDALTPATQRALAARLAQARGGDPRVVVSSARRLADVALDETLRAHVEELVVELPPLRERAGDVALLADALVRRLASAAPPAITHAAMARLDGHAWPGNVTELRLVLEGAVARARDGVIDVDHLRLS